MQAPKPGPLVAIDAPMLVFQSFYGIPDQFHDPQGRAVNAVFGFALRLLDLLDVLLNGTTTLAIPARIVLCWDESLGTGFRHRLYPDYKANRPPADEAFLYQLQRCAEVGEALGLPQFGSEEFEADDLMAALVLSQREARGVAVVVTHDKDLAQIIGEHDRWWAFPKAAPSTHEQMLAHWQMPLPRIADYLALCGDAVDNIPGVMGVGAVTARVLMQTYPSLETLYAQLDEIATLPLRGAAGIRNKLQAQRDEAFLFRELTRLRGDALPVETWRNAVPVAPQLERFRGVMQACNLWGRVSKKAPPVLERLHSIVSTCASL